MSGSVAIVVMAKAPVAGLAKTRLIPALGAAGAARLAQRMLDRAVEQALASGIGPVEVCCAPDATHPAFARLAVGGRVALTVQAEGDLGARMSAAIARVLATHAGMLLMGTDAPALDAGRLRAAADALRMHDAVFVPALDGGYALVGLRQPVPRIFEAMPWSTAQVMAETRARLRQVGAAHVELEAVADIDEPDDLVHLPSAW